MGVTFWGVKFWVEFWGGQVLGGQVLGGSFFFGGGSSKLQLNLMEESLVNSHCIFPLVYSYGIGIDLALIKKSRFKRLRNVK